MWLVAYLIMIESYLPLVYVIVYLGIRLCIVPYCSKFIAIMHLVTSFVIPMWSSWDVNLIDNILIQGCCKF